MDEREAVKQWQDAEKQGNQDEWPNSLDLLILIVDIILKVLKSHQIYMYHLDGFGRFHRIHFYSSGASK